MTENKDTIVLGIDYGETNMKVVIQNKVGKIVMGLPLSYDKKENSQSKKVRQFAKLLKIRLKLPLEYVDEYGSTIESLEETIQQHVPKKARRLIDHYSAAILLRKYYDKSNTI